jgi:hypothetical protein
MQIEMTKIELTEAKAEWLRINGLHCKEVARDLYEVVLSQMPFIRDLIKFKFHREPKTGTI